MKNVELVRQRADGHCEAMIFVNSILNQQVWTRCGMGPIEVHHVLPRSRGGTILDSIGETAHLMAMCNRCHATAHEGQMMIDGYVSREGDWIVYNGSDEYLSKKYPRRDS